MKKLGKITKVKFGRGGYQDAMFGLWITISGEGWGVQTPSMSCWNPATMECSENAKWTEENRSKTLVEICNNLSNLLEDAKVYHVDELLNKPVECTFDGNIIKSFRILTEVL